MTGDVQRDLGRMEAQIQILEVQVAQLNTKVDAIDRAVSEARGGWRMLLLVGGAAGVIGGGGWRMLLLVGGAAGVIGGFVGKLLPFFGVRGGV